MWLQVAFPNQATKKENQGFMVSILYSPHYIKNAGHVSIDWPSANVSSLGTEMLIRQSSKLPSIFSQLPAKPCSVTQSFNLTANLHYYHDLISPTMADSPHSQDLFCTCTIATQYPMFQLLGVIILSFVMKSDLFSVLSPALPGLLSKTISITHGLTLILI